MALALVAIVLVSAEGGGSLRPSDLRGGRCTRSAPASGFGFFFVFLSHTGDDSGMWPLVAARVASVAVVGSVALLGVIPRTPPMPGSRALTAAAGALDAARQRPLPPRRARGPASASCPSWPRSTRSARSSSPGSSCTSASHRLQVAGMALALPATILMAV